MTFLAKAGMWRERQVDMERRGMEANAKVNGETSSGGEAEYTLRGKVGRTVFPPVLCVTGSSTEETVGETMNMQG